MTEEIKEELQKRRIQLWKPPYYGVRTAKAALTELASSLLLLPKTDDAKDDDDNDALAASSKILENLYFFQKHALEKLQAKGKPYVQQARLKILLHSTTESTTSPARHQELREEDCPETWAERVSIVGPDAAATAVVVAAAATPVSTATTNPTNNNNNNNNIEIREILLQQVNPDLTALQLATDLSRLFSASQNKNHNDNQASGGAVMTIRLVCKGKTLTDNQRIAQLGGTAVNLLCLFSNTTTGFSTTKLSHADAAAAANVVRRAVGNLNITMMDQNNSDEELVASIRSAAQQLKNSGRMALEITDTQGRLVSMSNDDRLAFMTALGLHALGKQRMEEQTRNNNYESALFFLLQADAEWNRLNQTWRDRVDNFGLLQMDICWVYLKLQSVDQLPNVVERLAAAETALRKQVHTNFVTLAVVQAEMGNPVPALAAIFVRLFLLQGVAYRLMPNSSTKANERLDWARALATSLRAAAPPEAVARLVEAVDVTPQQAISALRRKNGQADQAAALIQEEDMSAEKTAQDRYKQRKYGLCENCRDYVDLEGLEQIRPILGLAPGADAETIASGLLRLANNDIERALDVYQSCMRSTANILQRVEALDMQQGVRRKKYKRLRVEVDEVAFASLLSMGVDPAEARTALQKNANDIEAALMWVTRQNNAVAASANAEHAPSTQNEAKFSVVETMAPGENLEGEFQVGDSRDTSMEDDAESDQMKMAAQPDNIDEGIPNEAENEDSEHENDDDGGNHNMPIPRCVDPERDAFQLLERILGDVLSKQHKGDEECLGNSLDEEWAYIEQYHC